MCTTTHFRSRTCRHHWLQIRTQCWPGHGFNTCPTFGDGVAREASPLVTVAGRCPACVMPGQYDMHLVRMIVDIQDRVRWGLGPSRGDPGCECGVM
ncbi:uncharacterized protein GGS25DRAFT_53286 [Hypoxylon fragiforme]|uniref:uncharacterized protein n=1 Tax=Hypoxylon fragiforme TaxID=63214 RepID=UPI0020C6368F|nr:uncharacterized protein GGS25DRAFT_53286 [Hypoxylon fragiforme]KAI2614489.1 hypothetical protein GGS25DRAFT_53286 [Hypoxylon fragiforme]